VKFYLGTHMPSWLWRHPVAPRMFVSVRRLVSVKGLRPALVDWALDSGGFTELRLHGRWTVSARDYVAEVRRYREGIGRLQWAAPQDWMCEADCLAKTGLTVADHQRRTIHSVLELRSIDPNTHWIPVLQGMTATDYLEHAEAYEKVGIALVHEPLVGLGSVCRRQNDDEIVAVVREIAELGIRMHGFGVKRSGVARLAPVLESADSMAWSYHARREPALPGCTHNNCANCPLFAAQWSAELLDSIGRTMSQQELFPIPRPKELTA
jgi:hypothetical protein